MKKIKSLILGIGVALLVVIPTLSSQAAAQVAVSRSSAPSTVPRGRLVATVSPQVTYEPANLSGKISFRTGTLTISIMSNDWVVYPSQKVDLVYKVVKPSGADIGPYAQSPCTHTSKCTRGPIYVFESTPDGCWVAGQYSVHLWGYSYPTGYRTTVTQRSTPNPAIFGFTVPNKICDA